MERSDTWNLAIVSGSQQNGNSQYFVIIVRGDIYIYFILCDWHPL